MESLTVDTVMKLAEQLSEGERTELIHRLQRLSTPRQRPSDTLRVFHIDHIPEQMTLRREDEYGDDDR